MSKQLKAPESKDMREKDLRGCDLRGMNLRRVKFFQANLQDADLRGSDLSDADFSYANLQGADLRGCIFGGSHATIFMGADMRGVILDEVLTDSSSGNCDLRGIKRGERTTEKYVVPQWPRDHSYDSTLSIRTAYETEANGYIFTIIHWNRVEASRWYLYARPVGASLWVDNCSIRAFSGDNLTMRDCKELAEYLINENLNSVKRHWVESGNAENQPKPESATIERLQKTVEYQGELIDTLRDSLTLADAGRESLNKELNDYENQRREAKEQISGLLDRIYELEKQGGSLGKIEEDSNTPLAEDSRDILKEILAFWESGEPIHPRVAEEAQYTTERLDQFIASKR